MPLCSFFDLFGAKLRSLKLHQHQFAPFEIYDEDSLDNFIRGLVTQPSQDMDASFSREVRSSTCMQALFFCVFARIQLSKNCKNSIFRGIQPIFFQQLNLPRFLAEKVCGL